MHRFVSTILACACVIIFCGGIVADDVIAPVDPQLGRPVDFYKDVHPILQAKCLACHSSAVAENDLVLESAESILKGGASGEGVVPGKPEESYLYMVSTRGDEPAMPPLPNKAQAKSLTPRELGIMKQWIVEGAKAGTRPTTSNLAWQPVPETYKAVYSLEVSPEQRYVYAGRGNRIFVYDLVTKQEITRLTDPSLVAIQQDGKALYGAGVAHQDFVHSLALSPNGKTLASGGYRVVKLWEKSQPEMLLEHNLKGKVLSSSLSANGTWAAFLLEDRSIVLLNLINGSNGPVLAVDAQETQAVAFAADGESLLTADGEGVIRRWHLGDGKEISKFKTTAPVVGLAVRKINSQIITAHTDHVIRIWEDAAFEAEADPKPTKELAGHSQTISTVQVLVNDTELLTGSADGTVRLWNLDNGSAVFNQNQQSPVLSATSSIDQQFIVASGQNKLATIWSRDGKKIADVSGNQQLAQAVLRLTDDQTVAKAQLTTADTALKEMEKDVTQREESLKKAKEEIEKTKTAQVEAEKKAAEQKTKTDEATKNLAEKPEDDGLKKAKEAADKELEKLDGEAKKAVAAAKSAVRAVELSESSLKTAKETLERRKVEKTGAEEKVQQVETELKKVQEAAKNSPQPITGLSLLADGSTLITVGSNQPAQQWNVSTGKSLGELGLDAHNLQHISTTSNGALLTVSDNGLAKLWDVAPRWTLLKTLGIDSAETSQPPFADRITALAFSPDGTTLAIGGGEPSRSGEISLWDVAKGTLLRQISEPHSDTVFDIEFSRDGRSIVSGGADKFVKVFDVSTGNFVRSYEGHTDHVLGVSFKADGSSLASAGSDKAIKIWNTETGEQRKTINNYSKQVTAISFLGVSDNLVSCSGDKTVKFHTASNGGNYRTFSGAADYVYSVYASGDEALVVAGGEDGVIRIWNGKDAKSLLTFDAPEPKPEAETAKR